MPLLVLGEVIGVLHLNAPKGQGIDASQGQLADTFAEVVKLALSNIKLREALRDQAISDPLTGLFNRRYLDETLARELHRTMRGEHPLCVAMLDVDHFQQYNNDHGHEAGDLVLARLGTLLRDRLRGSDLACRYGGDEFTVILLDTDLDAAMYRLQEICDELRHTELRHRDQPLPPVSLSIGIAQAVAHGSTPEELMRATDHALYAAKRAGRDRIEVYQPA
jgi:diguanylate cyclase (GGDEF)-like protein